MKTAALRARIEGMTYGAHALARVDGKVFFVRHAAPGDEVEIEVREDHGSYAFAEMTALLREGPARRTPPCEYLPRCGGCPWQQLEYPEQLAAKERSVADLLRRIGGVDDAAILPIVPSPDEYGYRRRLGLRVEEGRVGYFAAASHDLVAVRHCLLAAPALDGALPLAQAWVDTLATRTKRIEVAATGDGDRLVFAAQAEGAFRAGDQAVTAEFLRHQPRVAGIVLRGRGWRHAWGEPRVHVALDRGERIELPAGGFVQVNEAANARLVETVLAFAACEPADRVLDLYAGFGNLSFPLARRAGEVTAVERDRDAVRAGERHARATGLANLRFVAADAGVWLDRAAAERRRFDLVVLDPPRSGAAEAVPGLLAQRPRRLVYVSCNPSTLARDLRRLAPVYRVGRVQPIDFFPQTYHVETIAELRLTDR